MLRHREPENAPWTSGRPKVARCLSVRFPVSFWREHSQSFHPRASFVGGWQHASMHLAFCGFRRRAVRGRRVRRHIRVLRGTPGPGSDASAGTLNRRRRSSAASLVVRSPRTNRGLRFRARRDRFRSGRSPKPEVTTSLQRDLLRLSARRCQIVAANSGHRIPYEAPETVVRAVRVTIDAWKDVIDADVFVNCEGHLRIATSLGGALSKMSPRREGKQSQVARRSA